jgi:CBS domain-containing protein
MYPLVGVDMSDRERFEATQESSAAAATHTGPIAERHESALGRYLGAVSNVPEHELRSDETLYDEYSWNLENNVVRDVMTEDVICVTGDTPFKEIVNTLSKHRVSAVPVVDADQKVLGVVSESDLLAKVVTGGDPEARIEDGPSPRVQTRRKSHGEVARELMSSPAVTIHAECSVVHAARVGAMARVRRLPVVDAIGSLVGIVTRSDLLRVFLRNDEEIGTHIVAMFASQFCMDTTAVNIAVHDGVVTLTGEVERRLLIRPLLDAVRATAGVVGVHDKLTYRFDDRILPPPPLQ